MTATPYQPITWSNNEAAFKTKLNAMTNNDQWLFENTPRIYYSASSGVKRTAGVKIASGQIVCNPSSSRFAAATVNFGDFFSQGCAPVVIVGELMTYPRLEIIATIRGRGTTFPDQAGFEIYFTAFGSAKKIPQIVYAPWIAVGY